MRHLEVVLVIYQASIAPPCLHRSLTEWPSKCHAVLPAHTKSGSPAWWPGPPSGLISGFYCPGTDQAPRALDPSTAATARYRALIIRVLPVQDRA